MKAAGAAAIALSAGSYNRVLGANERINLGVVGCGNRGTYLMDVFRKFPGVRSLRSRMYSERNSGALESKSQGRLNSTTIGGLSRGETLTSS